MNNSSLDNPYLIQKYQNGQSFYEIYSDGKCIQGGRTSGTTITFLKEFKDTDYVFTSCVFGYRSDSNASTYTFATGFSSGISSKTASGIGFSNTYRNTYPMEWEARGFIK